MAGLLLHLGAVARGRIGVSGPFAVVAGMALIVCLPAWWWLDRVAARADEEDRLSAWRDSEGMTSFTARYRPFVLLPMLAMACAFLLVIGILMLKDGRPMGFMLAGGGVLMVPLLHAHLRLVLRPGPMLAMDARSFRHAMFEPIPWSEIVGIDYFETRLRMRKQAVLKLGVRDPHRYVGRAPLLFSLLYGYRDLADGKPGYGTLNIPLVSYGLHPERIYAAACSIRDRATASHLSDWRGSMSAREVATGLAMQEFGQRLRTTDPERASKEEVDAILERMKDMPAIVEENARLKAARLRRTRREAYLWAALVVALALLALVGAFWRQLR